jgi:hypothetical protein
MDTFLTWEYVATFAGVVFATNLFVNFTKELPYIKNISTKYYTSLVAFMLIVLSSLTLSTFNVKDLPLVVLNSILVTFTATGGYDFTYKKVTNTEVTSNPQTVVDNTTQQQ